MCDEVAQDGIESFGPTHRLLRVHYVFFYPDSGDIVIAGHHRILVAIPAGGVGYPRRSFCIVLLDTDRVSFARTRCQTGIA